MQILLTEVQRKTLAEHGYKLLKLVGEGPYAEVYHAINLKGMSVALKIMDKGMVIRNRRTQAVMVERKALNDLKTCPYVCHCIQFFQDTDNLYDVREYEEKGDLGEYFRNGGKFTEQEACRFIYKLYLGIDCIHKAGYAHRDIKPENILVSSDLSPKIIDLECAYLTTCDAEPDIQGTVAYQSPEVVEGKITRANVLDVDWWSFGAVLYFLFARKHLFHALTEYLTFERIVHFTKVEYGEGIIIPEWAKRIIKVCLEEKDYEQMVKLLEELDDAYAACDGMNK